MTNKFLYNGKEKEELTDWYDYGWRQYDPAIGRWSKVDRFADKYYDISPYHYGANNPISFIDINGDTLWIQYTTVNQQNNQLTIHKVYYDNNVIYDQNGNEVEINSELAGVYSDLNMLSSGEKGNALLSTFTGTNDNLTIELNGQGKNQATQTGDRVFFDPSSTKGGVDENGNTSRPAYVALGHELGHIKDVRNGTVDINTWYTVTGKNGRPIPIRNAEKYGSHIENQIRAEQNLPLRTHYGARRSANGTLSGDPQSSLLNRNGTSKHFFQIINMGPILITMPYKYR